MGSATLDPAGSSMVICAWDDSRSLLQAALATQAIPDGPCIAAFHLRLDFTCTSAQNVIMKRIDWHLLVKESRDTMRLLSAQARPDERKPSAEMHP